MVVDLEQICIQVGGKLSGDPHCPIEGAGPLDQAGPGQITFAEKGPHLKKLDQVRASAVIVPEDTPAIATSTIQVANPRLAFAQAVTMLYPAHRPSAAVHPTAVVGRDCRIGKGVSIGAGTVIGNRVTLGDHVVLHPHVVVGDDVAIGPDSEIHPQVAVLERCRIGCRVVIHAGTVIGSDGFGFVQDGGRHIKMPHTGIVQIDDDVEVGANNTIDRAVFGKTWIREGVKTDNLVHIAHNVVIGEHSLIIAQVGIAGSSTIGRHVILAGQAGISGHLTVGDEVIVGPQSGIGQDIPGRQVVSGGTVAMPHATWLRLQRVLPALPDLHKQVRQLEKRLTALEDESTKGKDA